MTVADLQGSEVKSQCSRSPRIAAGATVIALPGEHRMQEKNRYAFFMKVLGNPINKMFIKLTTRNAMHMRCGSNILSTNINRNFERENERKTKTSNG